MKWLILLFQSPIPNFQYPNLLKGDWASVRGGPVRHFRTYASIFSSESLSRKQHSLGLLCIALCRLGHE